MKKRFIFLIFLLILIVIVSVFFYVEKISEPEETITGEATNGNVAVSVSVIVGNPVLNIMYPENKTYIASGIHNLNYVSSNTDQVWYNLNNNPNITINGNSTFIAANGQHVLYMYTNNTDGNLTSNNVTFTINTSKLHIHYNKYSDNGSTVDFNESAFEDLEDLTGAIIERENKGKVVFNSEINFTDDIDPTDNDVNLDKYTNISTNLVYINSTALPNFNKPATLYLYNLTFLNPRILRDNNVCPDSICSYISYSEGSLVFNVSEFSNYSAEETPSDEEDGIILSQTGGGGGIVSGGFSLDTDEISVQLEQGEVKTKTIVITNHKNTATDFSIENPVSDFVVIKEDVFSINPGQSKTVSIDFVARENALPEIYLGKITVSSDNQKKEIPVVVEIESRGVLLDVLSSIPESKQTILPGEDILAEIRMFNLGAVQGREDIAIEYEIIDFEGKKIIEEHETAAIETQLSLVKRIYLPENVEYGRYVFYVRAIYNGEVASASNNFHVVSSKVNAREKIYIIIIVVLSILLSLIIWLRMIRNRQRHSRKIKEEGKELFSLIKR